MSLAPSHLPIFLATTFLMSLIIIAVDNGADTLSRPRPKAKMMLLARAGVTAVVMLLAAIAMANLFT
jgi:hypothetical protein